MHITESRQILAGYERVTLRPVVSEIEKLLMVDSIQTGISGLSTGSPSLLSLMGLGKEIWKKHEAQDYVRKIRDEWED